MPEPTYLHEHRAVPNRAAVRRGTPWALAARAAPQVSGLRIGTDGHLTEIAVPTAATAWALRAHLGRPGSDPDGVGVGVEVLDTDLVMWFDLDGAERARHNPIASVVTAMFGRPGPMFGPVVFTGWSHPEPGYPTGAVTDISVTAAILLAGTAPTCDLPSRGGARTDQRVAEYADLDIQVVPAPREPADRDAATEHGSSPTYDALAHTVTADGDLPRCLECDEYAPAGGHPEHQPEVLGGEVPGDEVPGGEVAGGEARGASSS